MFIRCIECEYRVPEFEMTDGMCATCWERHRQERDATPTTILCGCGWGILAADQETIDNLEGCPICGRFFDPVTGWESVLI